MSGLDGIYNVALFDSYTKSAVNALILAASRNGNYCSVAGTTDAVQLTSSSPAQAITSWEQGDNFWFIAESTNTGDATVQRDGQTAKQLVTVTGSELPAGYLRTDAPNSCWYDTVNDWVVVDRGIERGSNVNGKYTKYADGRVVQSITGSLGTTPLDALGPTASNDFFWTFPIPFSSTDYDCFGSAQQPGSSIDNRSVTFPDLTQSSISGDYSETRVSVTRWDVELNSSIVGPASLKAEGNWYEYVDPTA